MIDPNNITKYDQSEEELEEFLTFWVFAAGKMSASAAKHTETLRQRYGTQAIISSVSHYSHAYLSNMLKEIGTGCYTQKAAALLGAASLNLSTCTLDDLESVKGIGPKTARAFLLHSRRNQRLAIIDTHILKFLRTKYNAPSTTPTGKRYLQCEEWFLKECDAAGREPVEFDLEIWKRFKPVK